MAYNMLGQAYYDKGLIPQAELARAQGFVLFRCHQAGAGICTPCARSVEARQPEWVRADDILNYKPQT